MTTRVMLADDHQMLREGLRGLLEQIAGVEIVGDVADGREALQAARELRPEVIVMDISMPALNGIEATRQITGELPGVSVVILSMHTSHRQVVAALRAGAVGFVSKMSAFDEVARAIERVTQGECYISPSIAGVVVQEILQPGDRSPRSAYDQLTPREREVLQLLAEGWSSKEVAAELGVSVRTADVHRKNILEKLGLESQAALVRYAIREGLVSLD